MRNACQAALRCVSIDHFQEIDIDSRGTRELADAKVAWLRSAEGGPAGIGIRCWIKYRLTEDPNHAMNARWQAEILTYSFRLLDRHERELLVYHWMPGPLFLGPDHPHLHVSAALTAQVSATRTREIDLDRLHLPTGQVTVAAFVRMLIAEFDVAPLRDDWAATLDRLDTELSA